MGVAVIGGLSVGTVLTLYVVPAIYSYLTSRQAKAGLAFLEEEPPAPAADARAAAVNGEAA